jgi:4-amino-4-deoxy-L-arabinose transferase-like glycosyltransferase
MEGDVYPPTAWKEPVYPFLVAGALQVFGERARPAMMLFNIACLLGTAAALFFLGRAVFDAAAGAIAAALLLLPSIADVSTWHRVVEQSAAGLMTTLCALALLACLDRPSWRRGLGLGALFGVSALTHSATLLFVPLAAGLMLIRTLPPGREQWKTAACVAVAAAAVIAPWTLRNYAVFGEFVAVRTGFGFNAYLGNPIFSETVAPGPWACSDTLGPLWTAAGTDEALRGLGSLENRRALYYRARDCVERDAPASYAEMNEAQREALYLNGTRSFVLAEPALAVSMGFHKARHFFYVKVRAAQKLLRWIAVVGALSALVRPRGRVLLLLGLAFCVPYVVALPFFDRYSYSIEPLVCLLAARTLVLGARALWRSFDPPLAAS